MASPQYFSYPGFGEWAKETFHYSQAVRIGNVIKLSGQGGVDPNAKDHPVSSDINTEYNQAFANVELALKAAGGKGWSQVYSIRSFHVDMGEEAIGAMAANLNKWLGDDHFPLLTAIGVAKLALDGMRVEIEVEALVE